MLSPRFVSGPFFHWSVFEYLGDRSLVSSNFGPRDYPTGSLVIVLVSECTHRHMFVSVSLSLDILETIHKFFLILEPGFTSQGP